MGNTIIKNKYKECYWTSMKNFTLHFCRFFKMLFILKIMLFKIQSTIGDALTKYFQKREIKFKIIEFPLQKHQNQYSLPQRERWPSNPDTNNEIATHEQWNHHQNVNNEKSEWQAESSSDNPQSNSSDTTVMKTQSRP